MLSSRWWTALLVDRATPDSPWRTSGRQKDIEVRIGSNRFTEEHNQLEVISAE